MRPLCLVLSACILALTAACSSGTVEHFSPPSFAQSSPITLDVANIEVIDEYKAPMKAPNVDQFFTVTPSEAVRSWVRDRLREGGSSRTLQVVIKDGSVVEAQLPLTKGVKGAFTDEQAQRYDGRLEVELRIYGGRAMSEASINAVVTRSITVSEKASLAERERAFNQILTNLITDMNAELEKNIYQYFGNYIAYTPM